MGLLEPWHIIIIVAVLLLFFGGKKIPDLMKGIGRGVREFNDAKTHVKNEIEAGMTEKDVAPQQQTQVQPPYQSQQQQVNNPLSNTASSIPSQTAGTQQPFQQQPYQNQ